MEGGMPSPPPSLTPSCPCCAFLPEDIFLPPPTRPSEDGAPSDLPDRRRPPSACLPAAAATAVPLPPPGWRPSVLVDTHGHPHLEREGSAERGGGGGGGGGGEGGAEVTSLVCAVSPSDWDRTLEYASEPSRRSRTLPALGVHPWYLVGGGEGGDHSSLMDPASYLPDLERRLASHPRALVGEIGLCRVARYVRSFPAELGGRAAALEAQREAFAAQLGIAARLRRPASVHCVQMHGPLMKVFAGMREEGMAGVRAWRKRRRRAGRWREGEGGGAADAGAKGGEGGEGDDEPLVRDAFPPAIALHSFTGTAHHVKELLALEATLGTASSTSVGKGGGEGSEADPDPEDLPPLFYFGFSHTVNVAMCPSEKGRARNAEAVRAVPPRRLLAESDVHQTEDVAKGTAAAVAYLAEATGRPLDDAAHLAARNGLEFLRVVMEKA